MPYSAGSSGEVKTRDCSEYQQTEKKGEINYKPSDMWTEEDDILFCRYCPSKREKAYYMIARDTSARPHEILHLKIKSVIWNKTSDGKIYANVLVNGKTGSRSLLLTDSIPYLKDYLNTEHPMPNNIESPLICATGKSLGRHLTGSVLCLIYTNYKKKVFPNILKNNGISKEDKHKLQNLMLKPWNPYVRRHSSLTQKSKILNEHTLRQYAGWTPNSADTTLKSKYCPNCNSPNQPEQHYCMCCGFVLTLTGYSKLREEQKKKEDKLEMMEEKFNAVQSMMEKLLVCISKETDQQQLNTVAQSMFSSGILKSTKGRRMPSKNRF